MVRVDLERKIETLREELEYNRKVHNEEMEDLKEQISSQESIIKKYCFITYNIFVPKFEISFETGHVSPNVSNGDKKSAFSRMHSHFGQVPALKAESSEMLTPSKYYFCL